MLYPWERNSVPILQEAGGRGGGGQGPVWESAENLTPPEFYPCTFEPVASRYTELGNEINL